MKQLDKWAEVVKMSLNNGVATALDTSTPTVVSQPLESYRRGFPSKKTPCLDRQAKTYISFISENRLLLYKKHDIDPFPLN